MSKENGVSHAHLHETKMEGEIVYEGNFLTVQRDKVVQPDGQIATREYVRHPGAVVVLPVFEDGRILLERQFRYPGRDVFVEFPAGKIDPGESTLRCAQRELQEETGYAASEWKFLCRIHNALGYSDEFLEIFLARGLTAGPSRPDEGEFIETFSASLAELLGWVREGKVTDVKTVIGAFWLEKIYSEAW